MKTQTFVDYAFYRGKYGSNPSPWACPPSHVANARRQARKRFRADRLNGVEKLDAMRGKFPEANIAQRSITWLKGEERDGWVYGVKESDGCYHYECRYDATPADLEWMRQTDCNYLHRILKEGNLQNLEPDVWRLREMDHAQNRDIGEWWSEKLQVPNIGDLLENSEADYQKFLACEQKEQEQKEREQQEIERKDREQAEKREQERKKAEAKKKAEDLRIRQERERQSRERAEKAEKEKKIKEQKEREERAKQEKERQAKLKLEQAKKEAQKKQEADKSKAEEKSFDRSYLIAYSDLEFGSELGQGGFGTVYKGRWQFSNVAVKQLYLNRMSDESLDEFKLEASMMTRLHHDNVVTLRGVSIDKPGCYSLVMEYMPKGSLYAVLHNKQPLDWNIRYQISMDICAGLFHLHDQNILHRDLKSMNVLLDDRMRAKLSDFGLSKLKSETTTTMTTVGKEQVAGTIAWMAPELFRRKGKDTKMSDIYSLGMIFWEIASRLLPFAEARDPQQIISWKKDGDNEDIPEDCPQKYAELINWCWNQQPTDRPNVRAVIQDLTLILSAFNGSQELGPQSEAFQSLNTVNIDNALKQTHLEPLEKKEESRVRQLSKIFEPK